MQQSLRTMKTGGVKSNYTYKMGGKVLKKRKRKEKLNIDPLGKNKFQTSQGVWP